MSLIFFLFICLGIPITTATAAPLPLDIHAEAAILINADTGAILFEKNSHKPMFPASTTKIATALYALQIAEHKLDTLIEADQDAIASLSQEAKSKSGYTLPAWWLEPGSSHIGIKKAELLSLRDLLYGVLIASGNDAANVVAKYIGGTIPQFMKDLNGFLLSLGMNCTTFLNPHGLHHPNHKTTAYDMSLLARAALRHKTFCSMVATTRYTRPKTNKQEPSTLVQTNELLRRNKQLYYPKALGIKTGHTSMAQHTFVAAARDKERTLIAVLLKNKERQRMFADAIKMFEMAFNQPKIKRQLLLRGPQPHEQSIAGAAALLKTYTEEELAVEYYPAEEPALRCFLVWDPLLLPIEKGQKVGELHFFTQEQLSHRVPLYASQAVKASWFPTLRQAVAAALILLVIAIALLFLRRR